MTAEALLAIDEVCRRTGLHQRTLYGWVQQGKFPKPVKSGRTARWVQSEISTWIQQRIDERDKVTA